MKHTSWIVAVFVLAGCGGSAAATGAPLSVQITSHSDKQHVTGVITLVGNAAGGSVEIAIDDQAYAAAPGDWSMDFDTDSWPLGWHVVQARVTSGARQAVALINLYAATGYGPGPSIPPPPIVRPVPPVVVEAPTEGLVACWGFETDAQDESPNLLGGTVYGGASVSGGELDFDGTDDEVWVPDNASAAPGVIANLQYGTLSVRFKLEGASAAESAPLFYMGSDEASASAAPSESVSIYIAHGDLPSPYARQVYFTVLENGRPSLCFDTTVSIQKDQWYTYTVSIGPDGHKAYLDGVEVVRHYNAGTTENDHAFFQTTNDPDILTLGYGLFGVTLNWWHFDGRLSDVRIYDRVLSKAEVELVAAVR